MIAGEGLLEVLASAKGVTPEEEAEALLEEEKKWEEELNAPLD